MRFFRKMFAEKILRFHEGTNRFLRLLMKVPMLGKHISTQIFDKDNHRIRDAIGVMAQIGVFLYEFSRKFVYVFLFMYVPFLIISKMCPLVALHQERTIIFMFFILSTLCGSIVNSTVLSVGDRDYLIVRVMLITPYLNFLGNLIYKMFTEYIYYTIILCIFGVSPINSIILSFVTAWLRPIGEMIVIVAYEKIKSLYNNRNTYYGCVMALSVIFAYGYPIMLRRIPSDWIVVVHPMFALVIFFVGAGAGVFLWWYKHYRKLMRVAMHIKSEI